MERLDSQFKINNGNSTGTELDSSELYDYFRETVGRVPTEDDVNALYQSFAISHQEQASLHLYQSFAISHQEQASSPGLSLEGFCSVLQSIVETAKSVGEKVDEEGLCQLIDSVAERYQLQGEQEENRQLFFRKAKRVGLLGTLGLLGGLALSAIVGTYKAAYDLVATHTLDSYSTLTILPEKQEVLPTFERSLSPEEDILNALLFYSREGSKNSHKILSPPGLDSYPSWSPDGSKIAFSSGRDRNYEIYVMNADGSNQINLTNNLESNY